MPTVLVVDDTPVDQRVAGGLLETIPAMEVVYAANGAQAIDVLSKSSVDLVVTDMQMPEMDGLELVQRIRTFFAKIPVVLMTAMGSETIAIEALEQGASSYVPKSQLADRLQETVEDLLAMATADKTYSHLMACQDRIEINYTLPNEANLLEAVTELIRQFLDGMEVFDHTESRRVVVAVNEALLNALYRGNLETTPEDLQQARESLVSGGTDIVKERKSQPPYSDRRIHFDLQIDRTEARFIIRDDGPGFDHQALTAPPAPDAPALDMDRGRGLTLMQTFMDEVTFNEAGNEVTLVKRAPASPENAQEAS